ncbi:21.7 kDa class VI heat shock protein [Telopea speciosissima]|uniref:21.7 kDa class VI heat shock protein n=1 Tax=Telopea speciosissima TaxID=54955 RepID=UPI001CC7E69C|nr:21.7 kDa class VI heat shock protein [Telopea speciosissima]
MSSRKQLEVRSEDLNPKKWGVSLTEDKFESFISKHSPTTPTLLKVFGDGSFFSPLLFGRFFDPSDAFPLWEFESEILLSALQSSGKTTVDWSETVTEYVLIAELPGVGKYNNQVCVENGKILEISGQWKQQRESNTRDWKDGHWWEYGYVRRLELPEDADWRKMEANVNDDIHLEIRIPKIPSKSDIPQGKDIGSGDSSSHE